MSVKPVSFRLSDKTIKMVSESTKLTTKELMFTSFTESEKLMIERGSLKKNNPIIENIKTILVNNKFQIECFILFIVI